MSPIDNLEERLASLNTLFKDAPDEFDPYALPEPGFWPSTLQAVDFFESKAGAAFLKLIFSVDGFGTVDIIHNLEPHIGMASPTPENIERKFSFLKKDLITLGVDLTREGFTLAMVRPGSPIWDGVLDSRVMIVVRDAKKLNPDTGKPYRNAYLDHKIEAGTSDFAVAPPSTEGATPTDEIPF